METTIDNLVELKTQREEAYKAFAENEKETANALTDLINTHCCPEGAELVIDLRMGRTWRDNDGLFEFSGKIGFKTDDEKRLAKGWTTDFGSDFDIRIMSTAGIEINKGTCGSYRKKDKFQVFRDRMLATIWDNEEVIVACMNEHFNFDLYKAYWDVDVEVDRLKHQLENEKAKAEFDATVEIIRKAKFLAAHGVRDVYDDNPDYWQRKVIGKEHYYHDIEGIEKVTDKSVITYEKDYSWCKHRRDLGDIVYKVQHGLLEALQEIPEPWREMNTDVPPQEGEGD